MSEETKEKVTLTFEKKLADHIDALWLEYTRDPRRVDHRAMQAIFVKAHQDVQRVRDYQKAAS